jgi:tetratricopeptide (TPR) repeat protein
VRTDLNIWRIGAGTFLFAVCILGILKSWRILESDEHYWHGTPQSVREAIRLEPDCWWCYTQLARLDDKDAEELLRTSLSLNSYNSNAAIDLGLRYEADGDLQNAEKLLLRAFAVDRTYGPRWSLANFYFRHENFPSFWTWARLAAEMPVADIGALFDLCWRVSPDPKMIESSIVEDNPSVIRQYVDFLISKNQAQAAVHPALRLVRGGAVELDRDRLFALTDQVIAANDAYGAASLWHELIRQSWIQADSSTPNNPQFARDPLPVRFDWNLASSTGLHSWPGSSGLVTEFSGDQAENCTIAEQAISLPSGSYTLEFSYHTKGIAPDTGIQWEIAEEGSDHVLIGTPFLSSDSPTKLKLPFTISPASSLLRLRLVYHRQIGTPRIAGTLVVPSISIQPMPSP